MGRSNDEAKKIPSCPTGIPLGRGERVEEVRTAHLLKLRGVFPGALSGCFNRNPTPRPLLYTPLPAPRLRQAGLNPLSPKRSGQAIGDFLSTNLNQTQNLNSTSILLYEVPPLFESAFGGSKRGGQACLPKDGSSVCRQGVSPKHTQP
jgi:hypothetical protein